MILELNSDIAPMYNLGVFSNFREGVDSKLDSLYNHSERKGGVFHRISEHEKPVIQVFE
jgi:hypothetical protein